MRVLAINATYRKHGSTSQLVAEALAGAAEAGAETGEIRLGDLDIAYCTNCLTCYRDHDSEIAPCVQKDDMSRVLEAIRDADGVIFASPVHCGFVTALMMTFVERATFTLCSPTGEMMGLKGCPRPRLTKKARAAASIVSAGAMPPELRQYCDTATAFLRDTAPMLVNGQFVADLYAGAVFDRPLGDEEATRVMTLRRLTPEQLAEARELGRRVAGAVRQGVKAWDPMDAMAGMEVPGGPA